jgi:hypothetical protein
MDQVLTIRFGYKAVIFAVRVVLILTHMILMEVIFNQYLIYCKKFLPYGTKIKLEE